MKYDQIKNPYYEVDDIINVIYSHDLEVIKKVSILSDHDTSLYLNCKDSLQLPEINICTMIDSSLSEADTENQKIWFLPEEYRKIDVLEYCLSRCKNNLEINRVMEEYEKYVNHSMVNILKYMIYIIHLMNENNVICGVGRGSSVSSFILYLIGVHRINPIVHELDCNEFFKDQQEK